MSNNALANMDRVYENFTSQFGKVVQNILLHRYIRERCDMDGKEYHDAVAKKSTDLNKRFDADDYSIHRASFRSFVRKAMMSMSTLRKFINDLIAKVDLIQYGSSIKSEFPRKKLLAMFQKDVGSVLPPDKNTYLEGTSHPAYVRNLLNGSAVKEIGKILWGQYGGNQPAYFKDEPDDFCSSYNLFHPSQLGIMGFPTKDTHQNLDPALIKSVPPGLVKQHMEALFTFFYGDDVAGFVTHNNDFKKMDRKRPTIKIANFDWEQSINGPPETLVFSNVNLKQIYAIFTKEAIAEEVENVKEQEPLLPAQEGEPMDTEPATVELESAAIEVAKAPVRAKPPIKTKADPIKKESDSTIVWLGALLVAGILFLRGK